MSADVVVEQNVEAGQNRLEKEKFAKLFLTD
jgi:hypothetical protein